jgi:hypothetical protein
MEYIHIDKQYYCGVDLHANLIYICVLRKSGKVVLHQEITTEFPQFLKVIKPYLSSIAVCAESSFNWYWLADGCAKHKIPFFLRSAEYHF